jgi:hypothetical protein
MNRGTRILLEAVPLSAEVEAERISSAEEDLSPQIDHLMSLVLGCLVAGALLVTGSSISNLLYGTL